MARAFVFPGQGAQVIGMGKELADAYPEAKAVFEQVDEALERKLSGVIWDGEMETLTLTENTQPALMATSLAAMAALNSEGIGITHADYIAGHSLGEYSALCSAGSLTLDDTARLLQTRGRAMQDAAPIGTGGMAVLLGLDLETAKAVAAEAAEDQTCEAANDNDPTQVVVSGHTAAVERAVVIAKREGAKRGMVLTVSAPFHCSLMEPAARRMEEALADVNIVAPAVPVVSNVLAEGVTDPERIRKLLVEQITGAVRWRESILWMAAKGVSQSFEVGSGRALSGMIRRIEKSIACQTVGDPAGVETAVEAMA